MPDHLHLVIGIGDSAMTLGRICGDFKSLSTKEFWMFYDGKLWQRQFHDHIIRNEEDFRECVKYTRLNPVRGGLIENWQDWIYSGNPDL
jgi:REP element-mobilizing transposase RayT